MIASQLVLSFIIGAAVGAAYLWLVWRSAAQTVATRTISTPGRTPYPAPAWTLLLAAGVRLAAVAMIVGVAAASGAGGAQLTAGLVGFIGARMIATRWARRDLADSGVERRHAPDA